MALDALQGSGFSDDSFCFAPGSGTATETYDEYYVDQDALDQVILQLFTQNSKSFPAKTLKTI